MLMTGLSCSFTTKLVVAAYIRKSSGNEELMERGLCRTNFFKFLSVCSKSLAVYQDHPLIFATENRVLQDLKNGGCKSIDITVQFILDASLRKRK
jgi:hypothetical protein